MIVAFLFCGIAALTAFCLKHMARILVTGYLMLVGVQRKSRL